MDCDTGYSKVAWASRPWIHGRDAHATRRVVKLPLGCDAEHRTTNPLEPIFRVRSAGESRPIPLEVAQDP
jgi:hypothetical protein